MTKQPALGTGEQMGAGRLVAMLADRHSGDVFVPECKDGPTQTRVHRRLDAWALLKTWSPITTIGYEIKVDRSDWLRDNKIHDYMPLCHLLYIVAPKGLVDRSELPAGVGLMEPIGGNGRLQVRHKAARREIALPAELMVYVLMCRSKITKEREDWSDRNWRTDQLREWVKGKAERIELSYAVSTKIRAAFDDQERRVRDQARLNEELAAIRDRILELGFDPSAHVSRWEVQRRLDDFNRTVDVHTLREMRDMSKKLTRVADALEALKAGAHDTESVA